MNTPQFDSPTAKRRVHPAVIVVAVLFAIVGIIAVGLHLLSSTIHAGVGDKSTILATEAAPLVPVPAPTEHLEKLVQELADKIGTSLDTQTTIQQDIAALREQLEHMAAERAAAKVAVSQRLARQRQQHRAVRLVPPAPASAPTASVLSVDSWGGKPSVAILGPDGHIQFANQGDRVPGGGVIGAAQVAGQSVTIRNGDGTVSTVVGKEK